jgi:hypothetical protein
MRLDILSDTEKSALVELEKTTPGAITQMSLDKLYSLGLAEDRDGIPRLTGAGRDFLMHSRYVGDAK